MLYKLTMERTLRIGVEFESDNEAQARAHALILFDRAMEHPTDFDGGDVEGDFTLCDESGQDIIPWS